MTNNQAVLFLVFATNGVIIGLLFDFFRILRKTFKTSNFITYIQDILFWIFTGIIIIFFMYNFSDGSIRLYMFIGLILGFLLYILTISKFIINIFVIIINFCKKIIMQVFNIIRIPVNSIIIFFNKTVIRLVYDFSSKISKNFLKYINKNKIKDKNVKKNII